MVSISQALGSVARGIGRGIHDSYRLGGKTMIVAPAIVALVVVPEFVQHIVEITMGMFDSRATAHVLAQSPLRWDFGYVKLAGFLLAMIFTARLWAMEGSVSRAVRIAPLALGLIILSIAVFMFVGFGIQIAGRAIGPRAEALALIVSGVLQLMVIVWVVGQVIEDHTVTLWGSLTSYVPTAGVMAILLFAAFAPSQALHGLDHKLAMEQPRAIVWALMTFDAIVVGLLAALVGSAMFVGYRLRPTWRGWSNKSRRTREYPASDVSGETQANFKAMIGTVPAVIDPIEPPSNGS